VGVHIMPRYGHVVYVITTGAALASRGVARQSSLLRIPRGCGNPTARGMRLESRVFRSFAATPVLKCREPKIGARLI
jgi:hypothetical protein